MFFVVVVGRKTSFDGPKVVSEVIFPMFGGGEGSLFVFEPLSATRTWYFPGQCPGQLKRAPDRSTKEKDHP